MKYRIEIETRNSGDVWYIPQVKKKWYHLRWLNIVTSRSYGYLTVEISTSTKVSYVDLSQAEASIAEHKKYTENNWKDKVNNVTYKYDYK